jgi:hypothetical protein
VIQTNEIRRNVPKIAEFLDIPPTTLVLEKAHLFKAKKKFDILHQIDHNFLEEKVNQYCRELMDSYFPQLRCLDDAVPKSEVDL